MNWKYCSRIVRLIAIAALVLTANACKHSSSSSSASTNQDMNGPQETPPEKSVLHGAPAMVTAAFTADHPSTMIKQVLKQTYAGGHVVYVFTYVGAAGQQKSAAYDAKGNHVSG